MSALDLSVAARCYAERHRLALLPGVPGGKRPLVKGGEGFGLASSDPEQVAAWWREYPDAEILCATGPSRLVVIDVDSGGEAGFRELFDSSPMPRTPVADTPSGGLHVLFRSPGNVTIRCSAGRLAPRVDVRGEGGIVALPPAPGRAWEEGFSPDEVPFAPLPEHLLARLLALQERPSVKANGQDDTERIAEGQRNATLASLAGSMRRRAMSAEAILAALRAENARRCDPPLSDAEVEKIARSVARYEPHEEASAATGERPAENLERPVLGDAAMHGLAGEIVGALLPHSEADPAALLVHALVFFGNVIGPNAHAYAAQAEHRGNLYAVLIGRTGSGRKGTAAAGIASLYRLTDQAEWARERVQSGLSSGEGLVFAVRDAYVRRWQKDGIEHSEEVEGVSDKRILLLEPEFGRTLRVARREASTLSAVLRQAWDGADVLQALTRKDPLKATGAHVSVIGHVTPDELRRELDSAEGASGYGNRHLWLLVERSKYLPEGGHLETEALLPLARRLEAAIDAARGRGVALVGRDEEARALWGEHYGRLSDGGAGLWGAMTARGAPITLRLSLLYALLDGERVIRRPHLEAALAVWDYSVASVKAIFGDSTGDRDADKVIAALRSCPEGLTREDVRGGVFDRHISRGRLDLVEALLVREGWIEVVPITTDGRPASLWRLIR